MKPPAPSPELAAFIQSQIDEMPTEGIGYWRNHHCKELNALPIDGNQIYIWAIRPDGVVFCVDHESFSHDTWVEDDPVAIYEALFQGASGCPELRELLPARPADADLCKACWGGGEVGKAAPVGAGVNGICSRCEGRGWFRPGQSR